MKATVARAAVNIKRVNQWSLQRAPRRLFIALTLAILVVFLALWAYRFAVTDESWRVGSDYRFLVEATRSWMNGGPFYPPDQVARPFDGYHGGIMYPPIALALLVPFASLPDALWWAIPLTLAALGIAQLRPAPWAWPFLALCLLDDNSVWLVLSGNPEMWGLAALAWLDLGWPTLFFVLKPSLLPLAFLGVAHRSWWVGIAAIVALGLLLLPMWADWVAVVRNAETGRGLLYSVFDLPLLAIPLIAHIARTSSGSRVVHRRVARAGP